MAELHGLTRGVLDPALTALAEENAALMRLNDAMSNELHMLRLENGHLRDHFREALREEFGKEMEAAAEAHADAEELRKELDRLTAELRLWKPLTPEEAERAYAEAEAVPLSPERIEEILAKATDPAERLPNDEQAQLAAEVKRLRAELHPTGTYKCGCPLAATLRVQNFCPVHTKAITDWEKDHVSLPPKENP